ncbi:MAG: diphosphate--fructose-6-phosphate 1-phosphotransferase [Bacteroidales bacterium]
MIKSPLQKARSGYQPILPGNLSETVKITEGSSFKPSVDKEELKSLFPNTYGLPLLRFEQSDEHQKFSPLNVGVILSGGQAPGGHNVISGLYDGIKKLNRDSKLYGFLGGPSGLVNNQYCELTSEIINEYRNTGGFDIIGSGRTKLEKKEQFDKGWENCRQLGISALVVIGGDDSNTNAGVLAEYYHSAGAGIQVIGCPKTIDGDMKNEMIEASFGFDTACKVYAELIGNIQRDANSAKKNWHFIKLMGRSASHITLECALQTQPNIALISEEVEAKEMTLSQVVDSIADIIVKRDNRGDSFGSVLIPEGLIEFIPEFKKLIQELNQIMAKYNEEFISIESDQEKREFIAVKLSRESEILYDNLPNNISDQLIMDRDPHGNVVVSRIETEKLLIKMVKTRLKKLRQKGLYKGKFTVQNHFFGYEGRCAAPSNFDANYCYALGLTSAILVANHKTGYMASIRNLARNTEEWVCGGTPITGMMNLEKRHGEVKPVIKKALVELDGAPFKHFAEKRDEWAIHSQYVFPGPIQYFGPPEVCDSRTKILVLEDQEKVR